MINISYSLPSVLGRRFRFPPGSSQTLLSQPPGLHRVFLGLPFFHLRHLVSKIRILFFFSESASRVHVSEPCRRTEVTRDLYSLNLLARLMDLHRQILLSLAVAAIAEAILMRISARQVLFLHRVAPGYLKLVTFSNFWLASSC